MKIIQTGKLAEYVRLVLNYILEPNIEDIMGLKNYKALNYYLSFTYLTI